MADRTGTAVRPPAPSGLRARRMEFVTSEHPALRPEPDLVGSGPAANLQARRRIAARRWSRRAQQAARRAARASASVH